MDYAGNQIANRGSGEPGPAARSLLASTLEGFLVREAKSLKAAMLAVAQARPATAVSGSMYDLIARTATPHASPPRLLWEWRVLLDKL